MKSLVTGGAGFIGSHVVRNCLALGQRVIVLDDLSGGFEDQVPDGAMLVTGSIEDVDLVESLFSQHQFDYIYHLAAYAAEGLSHFIRRFNYRNNLIGSVNLINAALRHGVRCFVFTSSIAVYGTNQVPMREDMEPRPGDPYGIAKYAVELDLQAARELFGLDYVVLRPHNVYGENQNIGDRYRNVIGIFMNQIMQGQPMTVFGDGTQTRAFTYISDVAPHIANSVNIPGALGQVVNIGADKPYSIRYLADVVAKAFGQKPQVQYLDARSEVIHAYSDHSKARQLFGQQSIVDLEEGVRRMAVWAQQTGARKSREFGEIEVRQNLPPSWRV